MPKARAPVASKVVKGPPKIEFQKARMQWAVENYQKSDGPVTVRAREARSAAPPPRISRLLS